MQPEVARARVAQLDAEAQSHKRAIRRHRRKLREACRRQEQIKRQCRELGIALVIDGEAEEEPTHGRMSRQSHDRS